MTVNSVYSNVLTEHQGNISETQKSMTYSDRVFLFSTLLLIHLFLQAPSNETQSARSTEDEDSAEVRISYEIVFISRKNMCFDLLIFM